MGWAIMGGLLSSLVVTLVLIPTVYLLIEKVKTWITEKFRWNRTTEINEIQEAEVIQ